MRALRFAMLALLRDWRSGELAVLLAALLVAVTALTGVGFFTDRIGQAVELRAAEVLAADLKLQSTEPLDPAYVKLAGERGIATAATVVLPERRLLRRRLHADLAARFGTRLSAARTPEDLGRAFRARARNLGLPGARRGLARFPPARAARRAGRRSRQRRCRRSSR